MFHEELTGEIIGAAIEVHRFLGPGLLESAYEQCLSYELSQNAIAFKRQVDLPLVYKGLPLDCGYRIDLLVNESVIMEIKSVEHILPIHEAQLMTYLRISQRRVGLLINFNVATLREGITRRIR